MSSAQPRIFLVNPRHGRQIDYGAAQSFLRLSTDPNRDLLAGEPFSVFSSLLPRAFNLCLAMALRSFRAGVATHIAMLHADIECEPFWLDKIYDESVAREADLLSVVIPMKDGRGLTTTAIDDPSRPGGVDRRLTMRQIVENFPLTFTAAAAGFPDRALLVNTGCWIADLRRPWWHAKDDDGNLKCAFNIWSSISADELKVDADSEDWRMSRYLHSQGAKVMATRCVRAFHVGNALFGNDIPWGTEATDQKTETKTPIQNWQTLRGDNRAAANGYGEKIATDKGTWIE